MVKTSDLGARRLFRCSSNKKDPKAQRRDFEMETHRTPFIISKIIRVPRVRSSIISGKHFLLLCSSSGPGTTVHMHMHSYFTAVSTYARAFKYMPTVGGDDAVRDVQEGGGGLSLRKAMLQVVGKC